MAHISSLVSVFLVPCEHQRFQRALYLSEIALREALLCAPMLEMR